jgi:hypothetical protein
MRTKLAWKRARNGDPVAREALARRYEYLAPEETVSSALEEYGGRPGAFADFVRYLERNPPQTEVLATAVVSAAELRRVARTIAISLPRPAIARKQKDTFPRPEVEWAPPVSAPPALSPGSGPDPAGPTVEQTEDASLQTEREEHPAAAGSSGIPAVPQVEEAPAAQPSSSTPLPTTRPARLSESVRTMSEPIRPRPAAARALGETSRRELREAGTSLPRRLHREAFGAVLAACPRWLWPQYSCVAIKIADGEVAFFARSEALAFWFTLQAETTGSASAQIPREGACQLKYIDGSGPVTLRIFDDRVVASRGGNAVTVPGQLAEVPSIPNRRAKGGLIVPRRELLAVLASLDLYEARIAWDGRRCQVNGTALDAEEGTGAPWEVLVDARFLLDAARRGTGEEFAMTVGGPLEPVLGTSGALTFAIAPRCESIL